MCRAPSVEDCSASPGECVTAYVGLRKMKLELSHTANVPAHVSEPDTMLTNLPQQMATTP